MLTASTEKAAIIGALDRWIRQRPGLEFGNYGSVAGYRAELRGITRDLQHARALLRYVELHSSITAAMLKEASAHAYSGRLTLKDCSAHYKDGSTLYVYSVNYCTGQYWPTEYRRAACAVLASAIWDWTRDHCMPSPETDARGDRVYRGQRGRRLSGGDWLREHFRREFGRGIGARWFD